MAATSKKGDSKQALLDDLQSLRTMLDEDSSHKNPNDPISQPGNNLTTRKIPLLQDIFDPEHPEHEIQVEQLRADNVEQWVNGNLFDDALDPDSPGVPENKVDEPSIELPELFPMDEVVEPVAYDPENAIEEEDFELTDLYTEYAGQWQEPEPVETYPEAQPFLGLSATETEEFIELLIEEHADEILTLFKDILKDQLALLVTQVRDNDSIPDFTDTDTLAGDYPSDANEDDPL